MTDTDPTEHVDEAKRVLAKFSSRFSQPNRPMEDRATDAVFKDLLALNSVANRFSKVTQRFETDIADTFHVPVPGNPVRHRPAHVVVLEQALKLLEEALSPAQATVG